MCDEVGLGGGDLPMKSRADMKSQTAVIPHLQPHPLAKQQRAIATNRTKLRSSELRSRLQQKNPPEIILWQQLLYWGDRLLGGNSRPAPKTSLAQGSLQPPAHTPYSFCPWKQWGSIPKEYTAQTLLTIKLYPKPDRVWAQNLGIMQRSEKMGNHSKQCIINHDASVFQNSYSDNKGIYVLAQNQKSQE